MPVIADRLANDIVITNEKILMIELTELNGLTELIELFEFDSLLTEDSI